MHYFNRMGTGGLDDSGVAVYELYRVFKEYLRNQYSTITNPLYLINSIKNEEIKRENIINLAKKGFISLSELPNMSDLSKDAQENMIHTLESNKEVYDLVVNITLRHYLIRTKGMLETPSDTKSIIPNIFQEFYLSKVKSCEDRILQYKETLDNRKDVTAQLDLLKKAIIAYKPLLEKTKSKQTYKLGAIVFMSFLNYCRFYSLYVGGKNINFEDLNKNKEILYELLNITPKNNLFYVWLDQDEYWDSIIGASYEERDMFKAEVKKFIKENIPEYNEYLVKKMLGK